MSAAHRRPIRCFARATLDSSALFASVLAVALVAGAARSEAPDPRAIMKKQDHVHRLPFEDTEVQMVLQKKGGAPQARTLHIVVTQDPADKAGDKMRIRFLTPADVGGTTLLSVENKSGDDDQWLYLPAFRKSRRLGAAERGDRFAGTDLFFDDLQRRHVDDYAHKLLREEDCGGQPCYVIESTPTNEKVKKESPYSRTQSWIRKDNLVTVQLRHFDRAGKPLKEVKVDKIERVSGDAWRASEMTVTDVQRQSRTTSIVKARKLAAPANADATLFNPSQLADH